MDTKFECKKKCGSIPKQLANLLENHHLLVVNELCHSFTKQFPGLVLNLDDGMNEILAICAFLASIIAESKILIICKSNTKLKWRYHLTKHANYQIVALNNENDCDKLVDFNSNGKVAYILNGNNLNLIKHLDSVQFSIGIVEEIDQIANKNLIKRSIDLKFRIGITNRNFYRDWDQNSVYHLLVWVYPFNEEKKVQLKKFMEVDDRNFGDLLNNYRFWWFCLTWQFCDSFKKPTLSEIESYESELEEFARGLNESPVGTTKIVKSAKCKRISLRKNKGKTKKIEEIVVESLSEAENDEEMPSEPEKMEEQVVESVSDKGSDEETVGESVEMKEDDEDNSIILSFLKRGSQQDFESTAAPLKQVSGKSDLDKLLEETEALLDD